MRDRLEFKDRVAPQGGEEVEEGERELKLRCPGVCVGARGVGVVPLPPLAPPEVGVDRYAREAVALGERDMEGEGERDTEGTKLGLGLLDPETSTVAVLLPLPPPPPPPPPANGPGVVVPPPPPTTPANAADPETVGDSVGGVEGVVKLPPLVAVAPPGLCMEGEMEGDGEMEVEMEGEGLTVPPYTGCATPLMALTLPSPPQGVGVTVKEGVSKEVKLPPPLLPPPPHACTVMEGV